ncbi:MAG: C40 family peptidase [Burkholderiaceae bacterium]
MRCLFFAATLAILAGCAGTGRHATRLGQNANSNQAIVINNDKRDEVVLTALALLDTRYKYGGSTPGRGFDCSGFVTYVFQNASDNALPHNTASIARISRPIPQNGLRPGDFVFFNTLGQSYSHMGIYIGDGRFINAPSSRSGGRVRIDSLRDPYYAHRFNDARTQFRL